MKKKRMNLQVFADENITKTTDLEPVISIDCVSRLSNNITELQELLGVTEMEPMNTGTNIKIYKMEQTNTPAQVAEGETINLTKITRKLAKTIELKLNKYRRETTAEAIQRSGRDIAINKTDEKLVSGVQKDVKKSFYEVLGEGEGSASGIGLQAALSAGWAAVKKFYEDEDATAIYFVSSDDIAEYLGKAPISMQTAFGLSYVEDFLGLGTVVVSPSLEKGKLIATAKENLHGAYVPANTGDVAESFGLTSDETGLVGMTHAIKSDNATIDTLMFSGVKFYPEMLDGVIVVTITSPEEATGEEGGLDDLKVVSADGTKEGDTKITVTPELTGGNSYKYKVAQNATLPAYGQSVKSWAAWDGKVDITAETGKEIVVVECDADYKAVKGGITTVQAKVGE